jgi:GntR family transcriptional regulator/MocR family aminotransferase
MKSASTHWLNAASRSLRGLLDIRPAEGGMHVLGWLPRGVDDRLAFRAAAAAGVTAPPLSFYCLDTPSRGGLLLGYTGIDVREIREGVRRLTGALRGISGRNGHGKDGP